MRQRWSAVGLLLLALLLLSSVPVAAAQGETRTLTILGTSDLHGNLLPWDYYTGKPAEWGLTKVAALIKRERAANPYTLLLDNGDTIQGTPLTFYYNLLEPGTPHPMAVTMNALGFDSTTLGNHEFNYGLGVLNGWINQLTFPALSANTRRSDGSEAYRPYIIKDLDGVQVGILGLTTPTIPTWEKPANIAGLRWDDPVETAKRYVPQMRAAGADVIVIAAHTGWSRAPQDRSPAGWLSDPAGWAETGSLPGENAIIALAQQVPGVDLILAGHSHLEVPKAVINGVVIAEPSYWGRALSKFTVQVQGSGNDWRVVAKDATNLAVRGVEPDAELLKLAYPYHDQTIRYISTPIGTATAPFEGGPRARYTDSPLADLINTVQSEAAAAAGYPVDVSLAAIFTDSGMIPQGQITLRDAYSTYIYDNTLYVMEITGDMLRRALEKNAEYFKQLDPNNLPTDPKGVVAENARDYNWDLYTGIDYTIDLTRPVGQRVTRLQFKGQDVRPDQKLRIAINNYRAGGGGGYAMFKEGTIVWQSTSEIRDLMAEYIQRQGTIDPQRINVKNFTLVPDLYAHYFGSATQPAPSPAPSVAPSPAPSPPAGGTPPAPVTLPDTGLPALPGGLLGGLALSLLAAGSAMRRRSRR
ncbi:bifunctional metallophosphatase/5'-nucleotidase [Kallotenue papyrolyticum]|uniref:bifunctional metallophosphatase/5'-nucleotidase n=1 Tax=Kallotenue papyrolyticum TaxID=1325125 RepID=UPI00047866A9|nr:5'-nucleotidase C-terminal domain-containing protein [Kallotenue papyrolyticum]